MSSNMLHLLLDPTQHRQLEALALRRGVTTTALAHEAIEQLLIRHAQQRTLSSASVGQAPPFHSLHEMLWPHTELHKAITRQARVDETILIPLLLPQGRIPEHLHTSVQQLALTLASKLRAQQQSGGRSEWVQGLLQEFSLSSQEGVALMCLAEALLRIPDNATRDRLIRDKISRGQWHTHAGNSASLFVNATTWGLLLTGKLVGTHNQSSLGASLTRILGLGGEPLIRKGVDMAMRLMGEHFVAGQSIEQALANTAQLQQQGFTYSYDMLGEAAMTASDAHRYYQAYEHAIYVLGERAQGNSLFERPGISVKLSALMPRYERSQLDRVHTELYPRFFALVRLARRFNLGINIDAEEASRLEISLTLLERLCFEPELNGWSGIGFVIQAYQKRCPAVVDWLIDLAQRSQHRLMVRLVKGAYWDSEIKYAQQEGFSGYPVYTRKPYTDLSYLACAKKLLAAAEWVFPQFATHNAHTVAAVYYLAGEQFNLGDYEFQCLHGMGENLYEQIIGPTDKGGLNRPCRIYAPVGDHATLLAYLVRRLLENGANSSFVNQIADSRKPLEQLLEEPAHIIDRWTRHEGVCGLPNPKIPLPRDLYQPERLNSAGYDLSDEYRLQQLTKQLREHTAPLQAHPLLVNGHPLAGTVHPVNNPADPQDIVGHVRHSKAELVTQALHDAATFQPSWQNIPAEQRAQLLLAAAELFEAERMKLVALLVREAGKTYANALAEIREAVDFFRYYAQQGQQLSPASQAMGVIVCISPWNFPLAIFTGQVAAALAAGNSVVAKPSQHTPLIAFTATQLMHQAGIPIGALQLVLGQGDKLSSALIQHPATQAVLFTGSTAVAKTIRKQLKQRLNDQQQPIPLIAETGGINAMIVDSSALPEQVVHDVIRSAFDSAGQRCSALRVLCLQEEIADSLIQQIKEAMNEWRVDNPQHLATDIGPLISQQAHDNAQQYLHALREQQHEIHLSACELPSTGYFMLPALVEVADVEAVTQEVFAPILHVVRYRRRDLDRVIEQINQSGYGLTFAVHSRIDETIQQITSQVQAGNQYVNRHQIGAPVGVQPFGGEGLSGTGPKAGGPLYLHRLQRGQLPAALQREAQELAPIAQRTFNAWQEWLRSTHALELIDTCIELRQRSLAGQMHTLHGPTGERNEYRWLAQRWVGCQASQVSDLLLQLSAVWANGSQAVVMEHPAFAELNLPAEVNKRIRWISQWQQAPSSLQTILLHGEPEDCLRLQYELAKQNGALIRIVKLVSGDPLIPMEALINERSISINTAAAGGNTGLMMLD